MSEQQAPFAFRTAKPKGDESETPTVETPVPRQRKKRQPREVLPAIKVDLLAAIEAASVLDETDAPVFAAIVKLLNATPAAQRKRIATALVRVFG